MSRKMHLLQAIELENIDLIMELLSDPRTNLNYTDNHNYSAIHHSVRKKNSEIVRLLLGQESLDLSIKSYEGYTPLHLACKTNDISIEIVKMLLDRGKFQIETYNNEHVSPIHSASANDRLDIMRLLLENGANVNSKDLDGETCLHYAASNVNFNIIDYLLNQTDVDTKLPNMYGMNALCVMIVRSRTQYNDVFFRCACCLLERSYDKDPETGNYKLVDILLPTILASGSSVQFCDYLLHNFYSKNNSKYRLIKEFEELEMENLLNSWEFRYYIYSLLHESCNSTNVRSIYRFEDLNSEMFNRSLEFFLESALTSDQKLSLVFEILDHLIEIGFEKDIGHATSEFIADISEKLTVIVQCKRLHSLMNYLCQKNFNINKIFGDFLLKRFSRKIQSQAIVRISYLLAPFLTNFFMDVCVPSKISVFLCREDEFIPKIVQEFGDFRTLSDKFNLDLKVFSLKQICRNLIRRKVLNNSKSNCEFFENMDLLGNEIPAKLICYLKFDYTKEIFCDQ